MADYPVRNTRPTVWLTPVLLLALTTWLPAPAQAASGRLEITVIDRDTQKPIPVRMHLRNAAGRPRRIKNLPFWEDHFVFPGKATLDLPTGNYSFELERGPEYLTREGHFTINNFADDTKLIDLKRFVDMSAVGWWSGDLHVRRPVRDIELLMGAEDLHVAPVITWWNDKNEWRGKSRPDDPLVLFDTNRYYHQMAGGHARAGTTLLYFNLDAPRRLSGGKSPFPPFVEDLVKARENDDLHVDLSKPFWWDLPTLVALGQVDSIQLAHSHLGRKTVINNEADGRPRDKLLFPPPDGNARWSQQIYFHLLECGLRIPPTAGSGSGEVGNPVGYNRVYVHVDGPFDYQKWWENLRAGRVLITNGPLLQPKVEGQLPGHVFRAEEGESVDVGIGLILQTRVPISYIELIKNGKVEKSLRPEEYAQLAISGKLPTIHFDHSGWFLIRAVTDLPKTYRFAMTGPYYVQIGYERRISKRSAQFFLDWMYQRARQIQLTDPKQRADVLAYLRKGRDFWKDRVDRANAE